MDFGQGGMGMGVLSRTAWVFLFFAICLAGGGVPERLDAADATPVIGWRVAGRHPHDPDAFTQGLCLRSGGRFYESTGRYGSSSLRVVDPATGRVRVRRNLPAAYFGEGLEEYGGRLYQLTWRENTVFVFDAATLDALGQKPLATEGWGICHDGTSFVVSDGTSVLRRYDQDTFAPGGRIRVADQGVPVEALNELECVDGRILANVWQTDLVAVIDPGDGRVVAWLDLSGLRALMPPLPPEAVANGLARDPDTGRLWVTGKLWPNMFELELAPLPQVGGKEAP